MNRRPQFIIIILGILLLAALIAPFFVPIEPLQNVESEIAMAGPDSRFMTIQFEGTGGLALHYRDAGGGPTPIILIHGEGSDLYEWNPVFETLAVNNRTIAYDRPPYGLSDHMIPSRWSDPNPYTLESSVTMLFTLMDNLSLPRAVLVASGAGARVALEAALAQPERVEALVLVAPNIYDTTRPLISRVSSLPQVNRLGPLLARSRSEDQSIAIRQMMYDPTSVDQATLDQMNLTYRVQNWDIAMWEYYKADLPDDFEGRLVAISMPVMIVAGQNDLIVQMPAQEKLASEIPGAKLVTVGTAGHLPHLEHPGEVSKQIELFVKGLALGG